MRRHCDTFSELIKYWPWLLTEEASRKKSDVEYVIGIRESKNFKFIIDQFRDRS